MDVNKIWDEGGYMIPNPKYDKKDKKSTEPKYILSADPNLGKTGAMEALSSAVANSEFMGDTRKVQEYGITPYRGMDMQSILAREQSNWAKVFNSLGQTLLSEIGVGTLKAGADLFGFIGSKLGATDDPYSNKLSNMFADWQNYLNEEAMPIYVEPGEDISNGGLLDVGWYAKNFPSVGSSLALFIPGIGVTKGLKIAGKSLGAFKGIGNIRKSLTGLSKLEKGVKAAEKAGDAAKLMKAEKALKNMEGLSDFSKWVNRNSVVNRANQFFEYGTNALASRVMENYQEAGQVYSDLLPDITNELYKLDDNEYQEVIDRNSELLKDVDTSNRSDVAKKIAQESADKTFGYDMWNVMFDVVELYGLRNIKGFMNGPNRASVRRAHLDQLKTMNLNPEDAEKVLNKSFIKKSKDYISDALYGSRLAIAAQLSEGAEEAVNYIAQEEGIRYGHVLLKGEKNPTTFNQRLKSYLAAPGLYESAFWGVFGGVVFQAGGSKIRRIENAYDAYKYKKKTDIENAEKTGEQRAETHWFKDFVLPEIISRKNNIHRRKELINTLNDELEQINNGKNPWATDAETKQNLDIDGGKDGEIANILRDKAYNKFAQRVMMDAMFSGNWNLAKEFLASDEVKQYMIDNNILSQDEANKRQNEVNNLATKLEKSYDNNMRVIENSLHGFDSKTGARLDEIPFEFYQLVAIDNMQNELDAEQAQRNIDNWQPVIGSEEERLAKELKEQGVDYKKAIKAFILAKELGEIQATLDDANKTLEEGRSNGIADIDPRSLEGQAAINNLKLRKKVLTNMLDEYIEGDEYISQQAKQLSIIRAAAGTIKKDGEFTYSRDSDKFKAIDAAILKADDIVKKNLNNKDKSTPEEWSMLMTSIFGENANISKDEWDKISYQANIFDEMIGHSLGSEGMMKSLDNLSHNLLNAYVGVVQNEIVKQIALEQIAIGRDQVLDQVHFKHNLMVNSRRTAIELATNVLKNLAKNKFDEHGDISELLAYGAIDKNLRNRLTTILSESELTQYDEAMQILAISNMNGAKISAVNSSLPEAIKNTIYWSSRDRFEDVVDITGDEDERIDEEKSTTSKKDNTKPKNSTTSTSSEPIEKPIKNDAKAVKLDFSVDKNGNSLSEPQASLTMTDDGIITGITQKTDGSESVTAKLVSVYDTDDETKQIENEFDLNFGLDLKQDVFGSSQLFEGVEKRLNDNATIMRMPRIVINSDGSIKTIKKGIIDIESEIDTSDISEKSIESENESTFDQDDFNTEVLNATIPELRKLKDNKQTINEDTIVEALTNLFSDKASPEELKIALDYGKAKRTKYINKLNSNSTEVDAVVDAMSSAISDSIGVVEQGRSIINNSFTNLLNNYITRAYVKDTKYGKVISLENLLRYCNQIIDDNNAAKILYKYCVKQLHNMDNIVILEEIGSNRLSENTYNDKIINASINTDRLIKDSTNNGRTIDFSWILDNIHDNYSSKQEFYDTIYNLKPGDKLEFNITGNGQFIQLSKDGKIIGTLKAPTETPDRFIFVHKGWVVDIPKKDNGAIGRLETLCINCIINPNNDPKYEKVKNALYDAIYSSKSELPEMLDDVINAIAETLTPNEQHELFYDSDDIAINRKRAKYILDIFKGFKIVSDNWLAKRQMNAEDLYSALNDELKDSIHNWFNKLYDSSIAISILKQTAAQGKPVSVVVGNNNIGGIRTTSDANKRPINQEGVIGSDHKDNVFVGVVPFNGSAIHLPTGDLINHYGGEAYTFCAIRKPDGTFATVKAFPNNLNASHYSEKVAQIRKDIHKEFKKRFRKWFTSFRYKVTTDDLYDFFNKLCHSRNGNVPLCQGISVQRMTNGKQGITLEWTELGIRKRIRLYDRNLANTADVANIQLPDDKFGYGYRHDNKNITNEIIDKILNILDENLKFDINDNYIKNSPVNTGYARKNVDGTFVVQIPGGKEITFDSYNDFVINEGIISVPTKADTNGRRNFYNPNESSDKKENPTLTFDIITDKNIIESQENKKQPIVAKSDINLENDIVNKIKNDIIQNSNDDKLANRIFKTLLDKSVLKNLKSSALIKVLQIKNIKFVERYNNDFAAFAKTSGTINGVKINAGDIIVTQRWLDLINEGSRESKEQAIRHLIHEAVHKNINKLSKEQKNKLFDEVRNIFDDYVAANDKENRNDYVRKYEYNSTDEDLKKYYNEDGTINEKGLEEFLVESITRPELIKRLNEIAIDDKTIKKQKVGISKPKNLLQRIISSIINAFGDILGLKINKNTLLEKEYKLFENLILDFDNQINTESKEKIKQEPTINSDGQLTIPFDFAENPSNEENTNSKNPIERNNAPTENIIKKVNNTEEISEQTFEDDDFMDADDSKIEDTDVASINEVRQNINPENRTTFNNFVENGVISVKC